MERFYIKRLAVKDFGGLHNFAASMAQIALIEGRNGAGKTTLLEAIKSVFEGGSDPAQIRTGADQAEIELELTTGHTAKKTIRRDGFDLVVKSPEGGIIKAPKRWLEDLAPALSFDPVGFLDADPKDRAAFLLRTLPLSFSSEEVNEVLGSQVVTSGEIGLQRFNELRDLKYSERTTLNVQVRDLQGTIADMRRSLPDDTSTDWAKIRDALAENIAQVRGEIREKAAALELQAQAFSSQARESAQTLKSEKTAVYTSEKARLTALLATLEREHAADLAAIDLDLRGKLANVERVTAEQLAEDTADLEAKRALLEGKHGEAKALADQQTKTKGVLEVIEKREEALKSSIMREATLTKIIDGMDKLKHKKLRALPIDGFDLTFEKKRNGQEGKAPIITINGVPLDQLNRQQQIYIAIQFVQQSAGTLPLVLCECAELDDDHMAELAAAAKEAGIQLIVARWETGVPLQVVAA